MEDEPGAGGGEGSPTVEELTTQLAEATKSIDGLKAKNDELLGETKKAKNAKRDAEALAQAETEAKARESGDHEQLLKSSEAARVKLQEDLDKVLSDNANNALSSESFKIASSMAENVSGGAQNATLLGKEIKGRLKYVDGELRVTDSNGNLTVSTLEDLKTEFKNNPDYSGLLKGNQSNGGGALGGSKSGGAAKTMTRADFDALDPARQMEFMKSGGKTL